MAKTSFILHLDSLVILNKMSNEQAGELFKIMYQYQQDGTLPVMEFGMEMAVTPFINQFIRDNQKYENIVKRNKENGSKGGRPPEKKDEQAPKTEPVIEEPKQPVSDSNKKKAKVIKKNMVEEGKLLEVAPIQKAEPLNDEKRFISIFNRVKTEARGKQATHISLSQTGKANLKKLIADKFTEQDFEKAIKVMLNNDWVRKTHNDMPEHVLRNDNFRRYLNAAESSGSAENFDSAGRFDSMKKELKQNMEKK